MKFFSLVSLLAAAAIGIWYYTSPSMDAVSNMSSTAPAQAGSESTPGHPVMNAAQSAIEATNAENAAQAEAIKKLQAQMNGSKAAK